MRSERYTFSSIQFLKTFHLPIPKLRREPTEGEGVRPWVINNISIREEAWADTYPNSTRTHCYLLLVITTRSSMLMDHTIKQIDQEPWHQNFDSLALTAEQGDDSVSYLIGCRSMLCKINAVINNKTLVIIKYTYSI